MIGSNSALVDIGIQMSLRDQFTSPAGNIGRAWHNMMNGITSTAYDAQTSFANTAAMGMQVLKGLESTFEYSAKVQANSFLTNKMINDGIDHSVSLLKQAQDINIRNPLTAMDITSGQKFMAMAGMGFEQIKGAVEPAAQLAAIFSMPMGQKGGTADLMTNIMSMYNLDPSKAKSVADIMGVGVTSANTSMQDLAQAVKYAGATARMSGLDLKEMVASIGVLGNSGIQGSMAGTALANALNMFNKALSGQSKGGAKTLKALGLSPKDLTTAEGHLRSMAEIIQIISDRTKGMNSVDMYKTYFNLFGQRGIRAMYSLVQDYQTNGKYSQIIDKLNHASDGKGWTDQTMEDYMKTSEGSLRMLESSWENLKVTVGKSLNEVFIPFFNNVSSLLQIFNKFADTGLGKILLGGTTWLTGFLTLRAIFGWMVMGARRISLTTSRTSTSTGVMRTNMQAANISSQQMEQHLFASLQILTRMATVQGMATGIGMTGSRGNLMPLNPGYVAMINKHGRLEYRVAKGYRALSGAKGGTIVSPSEALIAGGVVAASSRVGTTTAASSVASASRYGTPLYRSLNTVLSRSVAAPLARAGAGLASIATKSLGFLMGPWGMAISFAVSFLPGIFSTLSDWFGISNSKEQEEKSAEQRQAQRDAELVRAITQGKPASISIDLNNKPIGTFSDGDHASVNLNSSNIDMDEYGM